MWGSRDPSVGCGWVMRAPGTEQAYSVQQILKNTYSVPHGRHREVLDEVFELEEFLDKSCHFFHHLFIHSFISPPHPLFSVPTVSGAV